MPLLGVDQMTVSSDAFREVYTGNGSLDEYEYTWKIYDKTQLLVTEVVIATGVETVLVVDTDYTVAGINQDAGGTITLVAGNLPSTKKLVITPNFPFEQDIDLTNQASVPPERAEEMGDKLAGQIKQIKEKLDRAVVVPISSTDAPDDYLTLIEGYKDDAETARDDILNDAGFIAVAADLTGSDTIGTVAGIAANVTTVAGIAANVTTVAGINAAVTTVAGISAAVSTVSGIQANVTTVAGISAAVTTVAGISAAVSNVSSISAAVSGVNAIAANVTTVAGIAANVTTVAGISGAVTTVAGIDSEVTTVAGIAASVTAVAAIDTDVTAVAAIDSDVTTVAGIAADVTAVVAAAGDIAAVTPIAADITTVAGIAANVTTVAGIAANVTTVAGIDTEIVALATAFSGGAILASTYGGTGNGFTKFTGASASEKTYTLPNASATILTDNAAVSVAQGGTGAATAAAARTNLGLPAIKWCVFDGSAGTPSVIAGQGFSSITDSGTGNYTANYDGNFTSANHAVTVSARRNVGVANWGGATLNGAPTTSNVPIYTVYTNQTTGVGTSYDASYVSVIAMGTLA